MKQSLPSISLEGAMAWLRENLLLFLTFSGVVSGFVLGLGLRHLELESETILLLAYPGELFMRLLKLMILPLIIASLITGAASLNAKMNGMIAMRTIAFFMATSLLAACIGLILVIIIHPGTPEIKAVVGSGTQEEKKIEILDNFLDLGRNVVPDNLFQATFQTAGTKYEEEKVNNTTLYKKALAYRSGTNTLGIIFFCLTFGTVLGSIGRKADPVVNFFRIIDEVIMKMVNGIMWISPVGISSVICAKILGVANLSSVMSQLGMFILTACSGIFIFQFVIYQAIYFFFIRKNPFKFWWGLFQAWMTAFATASTAAALPITFRCMDEKNKVDPRISKFVLPIGATVNMDGTALFVTVASIFIAQMNDIPLNAGSYATVVLTATAASIASASVPSAALVLMMIVLTAIEAPVADVSLLWAIDWFVDRCRTTNNMMGDCYCAAVVEALSRKELDAMDQLNEKIRVEEEEKVAPVRGMHKSPSTSSNGSRVAVPEEVIVVENSTDEEDEETKALNPLPLV